jgi:hypothetical protein
MPTGVCSCCSHSATISTAWERCIGRGSQSSAPGCWGTAYAEFLLQQRGDAAGAQAAAQHALGTDCRYRPARELLGLSHYVAWAQAGGARKSDELNKARAYLPPGPQVLYRLACSDKTLGAARALIASGEPVDQKDNDNLTALAQALNNSDFGAALRLMKIGARPDTLVGDTAMPVALLPVVQRNPDGVRLLQKAGVDYASLEFHGHSAYDYARALGDQATMRLLTGTKTTQSL